MLPFDLPRPRLHAAAILSFALASTLGVVGCNEPSGPQRELSGERIYNRNCARCHGTDGLPTKEMPTARDLTVAPYMDSLSDDQIRRVIRQGKPPNMPGFGMQFAEPSMKVLVAYVRGFSDPSVYDSTRPRAQSAPAPSETQTEAEKAATH